MKKAISTTPTALVVLSHPSYKTFTWKSERASLLNCFAMIGLIAFAIVSFRYTSHFQTLDYQRTIGISDIVLALFTMGFAICFVGFSFKLWWRYYGNTVRSQLFPYYMRKSIKVWKDELAKKQRELEIHISQAALLDDKVFNCEYEGPKLYMDSVSYVTAYRQAIQDRIERLQKELPAESDQLAYFINSVVPKIFFVRIFLMMCNYEYLNARKMWFRPS